MTHTQERRAFSINARGKDGDLYAVYFMTDTVDQAEHIVEQTGLVADESGVVEIVGVVDGAVN